MHQSDPFLAVVRYCPPDSSSLTEFQQSCPPPPLVGGVEQFNAIGVAALNQTAEFVSAEWLLITLPIQNPSPELLDQVRGLTRDNPDSLAFFRLCPLQVKNYTPTQSEFQAQICGIVPSCVLVHRQSLLDWGGFSLSHPHAFDLELFFRCMDRSADTGKTDFAVCPPTSLPSLPATDGVLLFGMERVGQLTRLTHHFAGSAPAYWFAAYAERLRQASQALPDAVAEVGKLLEALARHVAFRIALEEQHYLSPYLRRSVFDVPVGSESPTPDLDARLQEVFNKPAAVYPAQTGLQCFSMGFNCHAAQALKRLALRRRPGPFDWIFSNLSSLNHMLEHGFDLFLDVEQCQPVAPEDKQDPQSNVAEHLYYKQAFGVRFMFNHHNLNVPEHLEYFEDAVANLTEALDSPEPCLLVMMTQHAADLDKLDLVLTNLRARGTNNKLLAIWAKRLEADQGAVFSMNEESDCLKVQLPVSSRSTGTEFENPLDEQNLQRIVHATALGWF